MKRSVVVLIAFVVMLAGVQTVQANTLGLNITVADGFAVVGYNGIGQGGEDNETEGTPNTIQSQDWDLEGVFLNGNILAMVGGFKFDTGVYHGSTWYTSGDIFIDVKNSGQLWDYAIRMNFGSTNRYDVLDLSNLTTFVVPTDVPLSTPWRVNSNYTYLSQNNVFTFGLITDSGFSGWQSVNPGSDGDPHWVKGQDKHYVVDGFNLGFLGLGANNFSTHFTMKCGNDLLIGEHTAVPEPTSILLLGLGLTGLALRIRRKA